MNRSTYVLLLGSALIVLIAVAVAVATAVERFEEQVDPQKLLERVKGILEKIDNPELINHILTIVDKDPGQLARMHLASQS